MDWTNFLEQRADEAAARANALGLQSLADSRYKTEAQAQSERAQRLRQTVEEHKDLSMISKASDYLPPPPSCRRCREAAPCTVVRAALEPYRSHEDFKVGWLP